MGDGYFFVSHATEDAEFAAHAVACVEATGARCWIAPRDIPPRSIYAEEIDRGVQGCVACVVILSKSANLSAAVKRELELASHYDKPFIPLRIDDAEPGPGLNYYLRNTQWLDYRREGDAAFDRLVNPGVQRALSTAVQRRGTRTILVVAATSLAFALLAGGWWLQSEFLGRDAKTVAREPQSIEPITDTLATAQLASEAEATEPVRRYFPNGATAANFCELLNQIAADGRSAFSGRRNGPAVPQEDGSTFYASNIRLPGAAHCAVATMPEWSTPSYVCFWNTTSAEVASNSSAELVQTIYTCPGVVRGVRGSPAIGDIQFEAAVLRGANADVVTLSAADASSIQLDAATARAAQPRFPNNTSSNDFCGTMSLAAAELNTQFSAWRRAPRRTLERGASWASSFEMPGAEFCSITETAAGQSSFVCYWNTPSPEIAEQEAAGLTASIRNCRGAERGFEGHPRLHNATFSAGRVGRNPEVVTLMVWQPTAED